VTAPVSAPPAGDGDRAESRTETADLRTPTVDIDERASEIAGALIDETWSYRSEVDRYAALLDRHAVLMRAAQLVYEESSHEVAAISRRTTDLAAAQTLTQLVRRISESGVRRLRVISERLTAAAE